MSRTWRCSRCHLAQGSSCCRGGEIYEAAQRGARSTSPDRTYYGGVKERLGGNRAALSLARKLARRAHHRLRALGDEAFAPA